MSEDVEEGHSEGNILIITGKNFEGIAYNEDTHGELHKNKFGIIFKNFIIIFNISKMRISGPSDSSSTLIFNDLFVKAFIGQTRSWIWRTGDLLLKKFQKFTLTSFFLINETSVRIICTIEMKECKKTRRFWWDRSSRVLKLFVQKVYIPPPEY